MICQDNAGPPLTLWNGPILALEAGELSSGNGPRVKRAASGTTTVYIFSGSKVIAEYVNGAAPASPTREYIYSKGTLLAKIEGSATNYYHADHLSVRVTTDSNGNVAGQQAHYPYGESWYAASTTTKWQFTSYERDFESGNDYAMARFNVNRLGRFSSPDPIAGSVADPQSLNRYGYVLNDAVNLTDPAGLVPLGLCLIDGSCPFPVWRGPGPTGFDVGWNALDILGLAFSPVTNGPPGPRGGVDISYPNEGLAGLELLLQLGGDPGGGGEPPGLPKFSKEAFNKCANGAFGATGGNIPGTDRSIPGYDAALAVFQASLLTGADAATVA